MSVLDYFGTFVRHDEVFDISGSSSFKPGNSASQFQERSFLSEEATVQRNVTNGLTRTMYQNIKVQGLLQNMTKHEECKAAMITFNP